jgi:hypothetical protein
MSEDHELQIKEQLVLCSQTRHIQILMQEVELLEGLKVPVIKLQPLHQIEFS